jgi:hypothetical protein
MSCEDKWVIKCFQTQEVFSDSLVSNPAIHHFKFCLRNAYLSAFYGPGPMLGAPCPGEPLDSLFLLSFSLCSQASRRSSISYALAVSLFPPFSIRSFAVFTVTSACMTAWSCFSNDHFGKPRCPGNQEPPSSMIWLALPSLTLLITCTFSELCFPAF